MVQPMLNYGFAGNSRYGRYYQHSGQINAVGVVATMLAGAIAGALLAAVYAGAVIFVPSVKLNFLICLFYGVALGAFPAGLLKRFKVRNVPISLAVVGVVTLVSYYLCWASWEAILLRNVQGFPSFATLVGNPALVFRIASRISDNGTWTMGGTDAMKGGALLGVWAVEAGIIFIAALAAARKMVGRLPFCEKCEQWCTGPKLVRMTAPVDSNTLRTKLEAGDFAFVATLPPPPGGKLLEFHHHCCEKCNQLNTLSVVYRAVTRDKKGRARSNKKTTVIDKLLVQPDDLKKLVPAAPLVNAGAAPASIAQS